MNGPLLRVICPSLSAHLEYVLKAMLCVTVALLAGCASSPVLTTEYISPRVTGRVLDAETHQPIANARVRKILNPNQVMDATVDQAPKGGQALQNMQAVGTRTDREGRFMLSSQRDMSIVRHGGWSEVTLALSRDGYAKLTTNYTLMQANLSPDGQPEVNAGDILLKPLSK